LRPELAAAWQAVNPEGWPGGEEERVYFGADHAGAGAYLLSLWCLPTSIVNAVAWHLSPGEGVPSLPLEALRNVKIRQLAANLESNPNLAVEFTTADLEAA
jgi:hypothetical protein